MTVIAVKVSPKVIEVAWDSIVTQGYTKRNSGDIKIARTGSMVIGGAGLLADITLFTHFCMGNPLKAVSLDAVITFMLDFKKWRKDHASCEKDSENHFLLIHLKKVFVTDNYMPQLIKDYEAIGMGRDFALAALALKHTAKEAAEIACKLSVYCEKPVKTLKIAK